MKSSIYHDVTILPKDYKNPKIIECLHQLLSWMEGRVFDSQQLAFNYLTKLCRTIKRAAWGLKFKGGLYNRTNCKRGSDDVANNTDYCRYGWVVVPIDAVVVVVAGVVDAVVAVVVGVVVGGVVAVAVVVVVQSEFQKSCWRLFRLSEVMRTSRATI